MQEVRNISITKRRAGNWFIGSVRVRPIEPLEKGSDTKIAQQLSTWLEVEEFMMWVADEESTDDTTTVLSWSYKLLSVRETGTKRKKT